MLPLVILGFPQLILVISWLAVAISYSQFYLVNLGLFLSYTYLILVLLALTRLMSQFLLKAFVILGSAQFISCLISVLFLLG